MRAALKAASLLGTVVLAVLTAAPAQGVAAVRWGLWQSSNHLDYSLGTSIPNYQIQYYGWQERPQLAEMNAMPAGSEPFLEMQTCGNPCNDTTAVPITDVINGAYDTYLVNFANDLVTYGKPVLLTFDHEMNGGWYPWGSGKITADQWVQAWHHVTATISAIASNVAWVWAPNVETTGVASFAPYWPGRLFSSSPRVTYLGLDGYYKSDSNNWANTFASSVTDIRSVGGNKPFMVTETGVNNTDTGYLSQIDDLVNGFRSVSRHSAIMYFDKDGLQPWSFTSAGQSRFLADVG